ncbi:MAG: FecR domain-containing protein [Myxococcaceae bacterium]|nr:FecR domain-containing protein [Myxococcaceae bacterium]
MTPTRARKGRPALRMLWPLGVSALSLWLGLAPLAMAAEGEITLTVQPGTSFRALAEEYLGDANLWPEILKANGLSSPSDVKEGMRLKLPSTRISRAARQLVQARERLEAAARAGGHLLAAKDMARAQALRDEALRHRQATRWEECLELARQSEQLAEDVLKRALARRNVADEATLESATGKVQSRRGAEAFWRDVSPAALLGEGERVRTLSGASAVLLFRDGARLRLGENSQVVIQKMRVDQLQQRQQSSVSVLEGDAQALLGNSRGDFQLDAAGSATRVQAGSRDFWLGRGPQGQVRMVNYDEGEMQVATETGAITVGRNQGALIEKGRKPTVRKQLLPETRLSSPESGELRYVRAVRLEWQRTPGAASYWLEVAADDGFTRMHAALKDLLEPAYTFTAPMDGAFYWRVSAIDRDGFPGPRSQPRRFTVLQDVDPPHLFVQSPRHRAVVREPSVLLTGETEPGASLTLDGVALSVTPEGRFSTALELAPGERLLELVATDPAGNATRVRHAVDYRPPEPLSVAWASELVRQGERRFLGHGDVLVLRGRTRPDTALTLLREDGQRVARAHADATGAFLVHVPLRPGVQRLRLALQPVEGEAIEEPFEVEGDDEPPGLVLEPEPPAVTGTTPLALSGTLQGATALWLDGAPLPLEGGRFSHAVALRPGPNLLRLEAADAAGNRTVIERYVLLDREAPELLGYTVSPASVAPGGSVTVRVRARDASGLRSAAGYVLHIGRERIEGLLRLSRASGEYQALVAVPPSAQGEVRLRQLRLQDAYGNQRDHTFR